MTRLITTFLYAGLMRPAPGTWGSIAALPAAWAIHSLGSFPALAISTLIVALVGWWATARALRHSDDPDPSEIVIDEVAGMWVALLPASAGAWSLGYHALALWPGWVAAFVAFRLFDIWKPGPIGWADRQHGALGVMLDDLIAGLFAAVMVTVFALVAHGLIAL